MLNTLTIACMLSMATAQAEEAPAGDRGYIAGSPVADLNGDGVVDSNDLLLFSRCWVAGLPCADIDGNGVVDIYDLLIFYNA